MPIDVEGRLFLTITEVAKELRKPPALVETYIRQGRIKAVRIGRRILISIEELKSYQSRVWEFKK